MRSSTGMSCTLFGGARGGVIQIARLAAPVPPQRLYRGDGRNGFPNVIPTSSCVTHYNGLLDNA